MDINEFLEKRRELSKLMKKEGKQLMNDFVNKIFADCPEITAIRWIQSLPYFNDGDPCVFRIYVDGHSTLPLEQLQQFTDLEQEDACLTGEQYPDGELFAWDNSDLSKNSEKAFKQFQSDLTGELETLAEELFGSNAMVVAMRDHEKGVKITATEYENY